MNVKCLDVTPSSPPRVPPSFALLKRGLEIFDNRAVGTSEMDGQVCDGNR